MLEIEMKFPRRRFCRRSSDALRNWQATVQPTIEEADHYFNAPDRDFAKTDEAFRLRCIGDTESVTYKGPKQAGVTKTRTEIEIALEPGPQAADRFSPAGAASWLSADAVVKKRRTVTIFTASGFALQACLDEVETLGRFVEIEIVAEPGDRQRAQDLLLEVVHDLGLQASEPRSYLEMVLAKQAK